MRITKKYLIEWLNKKFIEFEITDYEVTEIRTTQYSQNQYESGACRLIISFENKKLNEDSLFHTSYFLCFYTMGYMQQAINDGYELCIKSKGNSIKDFELEIRKRQAAK